VTVNDDLLDRMIDHQIGLSRYSAATVRKIIALLNRVEPDLVAQIVKNDPTEVSGTYSQKRIEKMLEAIRGILRDAYTVAGRELRADLIELARYEAEFQLDLFSHVLPIEWDVVSPTPEQLKAAVDSRPFQGALLKEWVKGLEEGTARRLRDNIRMGYVEGESIDKIVRRIRGTRAQGYRDGVLETSRRGAEAMVRTAVNHTANAAREDLYAQNTDLIKGVRWVSTLDSRTSAVCRGRDGKVYPVNSGPRPPAHINCRSTTVPVTKSFRELGIDLDDVAPSTRASMDGQVPEGMSYSAWLRTKPPAFQDDILGKSKGKLFRDGAIDLDRFVDRAGREYTLDELRRRESAAFTKAGL
jgi:SPP1 gp7 family putative phage head morphogenesis protein